MSGLASISRFAVGLSPYLQLFLGGTAGCGIFGNLGFWNIAFAFRYVI
jgi:hypothetical protein